MNLSRRHLPHFHTHRFDVRHLSALPSLATNRLLGFAAGEFIMLFLPIFVFELFDLNLQLFFAWYALVYIIRLPLFVWGANVFSRTGLSVSMTLGTSAWILFYICLYLLDVAPNFFPLILLGLVALFLAVGNALYWAPFHVDFTQFSKKGRRGREVSAVMGIQLVLGFTIPILSGFLITTFSYSVVFLLALFTLALSLIPLTFLPNVRVTYAFGFFETFRELFSKKNRFLATSMISSGMESVTGIVVWPIFLYAVFAGNYLDVGIFAAMLVVVSVVLQLIVGKEVDRYKPDRVLPWGVDLNALGWIIKAFVTSVSGVFAASVIHQLGAITMKTPAETLLYEKAADAGHYIDEFTVLREIALTIGRVILVSLMIGVTLFANIQVAFLIAAAASFGIKFFTRVHINESMR